MARRMWELVEPIHAVTMTGVIVRGQRVNAALSARHSAGGSPAST